MNTYNTIHPKEKVARANEESMINWLRENDNKLPITIYGLSKSMKWSFGATRGTLLRLNAQPEAKIHLEEIFDPQKKKFKTLIAIKGAPSFDRLEEIKLDISQKMNEVGVKQNSYTEILDFSKIYYFLTKLDEIDSNVSKIATEITDVNLLQKFLDLNFGLKLEEKEQLLEILKIMEDNLNVIR
ncbi:hypothetical protein [Candidatus Harpocratesius sp.]